MQHHFNTEIAKRYDIVTAILLDNFYFWIEKNRMNNRHFYNDRYWTYNSKVAMTEWFPYLTPRQIDYAIKKMVEENLIVTANHSENKYDRTLYYAITDFGYSILQNCEMYNYNNKTYTNTYTNKEINKEKTETVGTKEVYEDYLTEWFNKVYSIYPRKVSKVQAKATFTKKLKGLDKDTAHKKAVSIYRLIEKQIQVWQGENNGEGRKLEHIPYLSSWLNSNVEDSKKK